MVYNAAAAALLASALVASVSAGSIHAAHRNLHNKRAAEYKAPEYKGPQSANASSCGCTTYTTTWYGTPGLVPESSTSSSAPVTTSTPAPVKPTTSAAPSSSSSPAPVYSAPKPSSSSPAPVYSAPKPSTSSSAPAYSAPQSSSSSPAPAYSAPASSSSPAPKPSTSSAAPSYSAPASSSSAAPKPSTSSAAPSSSAPASSSSPAPTPSTSSAAPSSSAPASSSSSASSTSAAPKPSSSSSNGGCAEIAPNGNKWAMTYTPYTSGGQCKSADDVSKDILQIKAKGFTTVRLYATDCSGPQNIGSACKEHGLNMILGVYIDSAGISKAREQVSTLVQWGKSNGWGKVEMVVVGNEAVFNGYCTAAELAAFIGEVKSSFKAAGYTGPCTTTEPLNILQENTEVLCNAMDVVGCNIHPFFNTAIDASGAGDFVSSQLKIVEALCSGKEAYNLETGWPSAGDANGAAVPGTSQQKTAVDAIVASAGAKSAIFSYENDSWKAPGNLGVEQYWGCADLFQDVLNAVSDVVDDATKAVTNIVSDVL
ncbi:glycoside hydrolase family 17 [Lecanosticta acicola]|uniref:Probable beta-glucosidase btgE n=1 Tax=Lecanosticta acicola TaxID=111012 RepID=A0AAI9EB71_9PEZI|nr:glycoside hydrolase family 17 [Lecanosticta acicola]